MTPDDIARRHANKRFNERLKLIATFMNNSGIAMLVGALVIPYLGGTFDLGTLKPFWLSVPIGLHLLGQIAVSFLRSED